MEVRNRSKLIVSLVVCLLAGVIGSLFTTPVIDGWYDGLVRPALNPPSWVFGPVWITLYLLMGCSLYLIWKKGLKRKDVRVAMGVFGIQLILNTVWSILFFGLQHPGLAFLDIVLLWLSILASIILFYPLSKPASYLLLPYILWVSFAAYLNYAIWTLN